MTNNSLWDFVDDPNPRREIMDLPIVFGVQTGHGKTDDGQQCIMLRFLSDGGIEILTVALELEAASLLSERILDEIHAARLAAQSP